MEGLARVRDVCVDTPFGPPSDAVTLGDLEGVPVAFLPRHGRGHRVSPTLIPARANIYALKTLGVEQVISVSAVGSLKEEVKPLDLLVPDQLIDRTRQRASTFFDGDIVAHVAFADPFCADLSARLLRGIQAVGAPVHSRGTYVVMEGPAFSTRAESALYRSWGADVIGMTALPEAKLAREAEMCYATLACVTDYDCWHEAAQDVTVEMVVANLGRNAATSKDVLRRTIPEIPETRACPCARALQDSIITSRELIPAQARDRMRPITGRYLN